MGRADAARSGGDTCRAVAAPCRWRCGAPDSEGIVQSGLWVVESVQGLVAEGGEQLSDLIVEAKAEYHAGTATTAK